MPDPIPVILDTDLGTDIDDSWALAFLLNSPELELKLITTATCNTPQRTAAVAKLLQAADRTAIPIGTGPQFLDTPIQLAPWLADFDLHRYPGTVHADGIAAMIETIMASPVPVTLIAIGPLTNVAAAVRREPRIAAKTRLVGMLGSLAKGFDGAAGAIAEYNVVVDVQAAMATCAAAWPITITPLDTCGMVRLEGERYRRVATAAAPLTRSLIESYRCWLDGKPDGGRSSILFDTVAVYLAFAEDFLTVRELPLTISHDGFTRVAAHGRPVRCALDWQNREAFLDLLAARLS